MPKFTSDGSVTVPKFRSTGAGNFPKSNDLFGALLIIEPIRIEDVPSYDGKGTTERLTADTIVLDGEHAGRYDSMYWSASPIVNAAKEVLRKEDGSAILGRLFRFPQTKDKGTYKDREELEKAIQKWRPGMPEVRFAWALEKFTDEDVAKAAAYYRGEITLEPSADEAEDDPFGDD